MGPLDGIGLLYRNQFRLSPLVGLEGVVRSEVSVVTGALWSGGDLGLMLPAIEPRTVGPLTFVHGGVGISALVPVTGDDSFDGVRFVPYASIGLAQVVWLRFAYTGQPTPVELTTSAEHGQLSVALPDAPCQDRTCRATAERAGPTALMPMRAPTR